MLWLSASLHGWVFFHFPFKQNVHLSQEINIKGQQAQRISRGFM